MKKLIVTMLAAIMLLGMAACGAEEEPNADLVITRAPAEENEQTEAAEVTDAAQTDARGPFVFRVGDVELVPGQSFDASVLSEASSVYEVPSCAIEGTDNVYNYDSFEVTAYDDGTGEVVYSIYFLDLNVTTAEGLALGDDAAKVVELYGEDYEMDGTAYVYTGADTQLIVIVQNDAVASIEYRLNVQ